MLKLTPSPAIASEPQSLALDGITITERTDLALVSLSARLGQEKACLKGAKTFLGADLPDASKVATSGGFQCFWTGPHQWFVSAPIEAHEDLEDQLKSACKETSSLTDQSGGWVRFDISGDKTIATFEKLCMVDLALMAPNSVQRTVIEHIGCFVISVEGGVSVWTPRSYAGSTFHAIEVAARSV